MQHRITCNGQFYTCRDNESILDASLRHAIKLKFSCRKGSCQVCMMQCTAGNIPADSQKGLRSQYIEKNYFLPCSCHPTSDMNIAEIPLNDLFHSAIIHQKDIITNDVCRLLIEPSQEMTYQPGQYINLQRLSDGLTRSYSLVSHPDDYFIELHIKKMHSGVLSNWIYNELTVGTEVLLQGPAGKCTYQQITDNKTTIILAGSGTGIAPLSGILNDALRNQHQGNMYILHQGEKANELYLQSTLQKLSQQHSNLHYIACAKSHPEGTQISTSGAGFSEELERILPDDKNAFVYLAGPHSFVSAANTLAKSHDITDNQVFSDSFDYAELRKEPQQRQHNEEIWIALEQGKKLKIILDDFYHQVYQDSKLSPFFENATEKRSSEKQYLFMRQLFTGEKVYFGDRPKNAHHWMVISNELFDYREQLLIECLRKHALAEHFIQYWVELDESFRQDIVKETPQPKIINGVALPLDGFETLRIDEGTLCDSCNQPIEKNEIVRYHLRLGLTYCPDCIKSDTSTDESTSVSKT
ncbi:MAG TPA: 2Fe-2S iron-sulfur cluster binding domain-containing protein [Gammaproteobacteria bacterium]|nr:2Fe-2S iron-sulfur cluster binding domain-containing protein [Gammaproteobacteria bacterium]